MKHYTALHDDDDDDEVIDDDGDDDDDGNNIPIKSILHLLMLSWNLHGSTHMKRFESFPVLHHIDVIVLGLQELPLGNSPLSFIVETHELSNRFRSVMSNLLDYLAPEFSLIKHTEYGYLSLTVFVRRSIPLREAPLRISTRSIGLGVANVLSNKGAVALRMSLAHQHFTFICCHLQAHNGPSFAARRRQQISVISRELISSFDDSGHVMWCGDFNFRVSLSRQRVMQAIAEKDWSTLVESDDRPRDEQLIGCEGHRISFAPTYKFTMQHGVFDYSNKRVPSYCDRVFYVDGHCSGGKARCTNYSSIWHDGSDHLPVFSVFECKRNDSIDTSSMLNRIEWSKQTIRDKIIHSCVHFPAHLKIALGIIAAIFIIIIVFLIVTNLLSYNKNNSDRFV